MAKIPRTSNHDLGVLGLGLGLRLASGVVLCHIGDRKGDGGGHGEGEGEGSGEGGGELGGTKHVCETVVALLGPEATTLATSSVSRSFFASRSQHRCAT